MHTASAGTTLAEICEAVSRLQPGESITVEQRMLRDVSSYRYNGATFTSADRVLGNIVGSSFTHSFQVDPMSGDVTFFRHEDTGERRSIDPDRR